MSALSRGRNPYVAKESQASKQKDTNISSDSDDDLIIVTSSKAKCRTDNPTSEIEHDHIPKRGRKKSAKVKLPKSLPKEAQKKKHDEPEIVEKLEDENDNNEDTLLALEEKIGRRFDENSEPNQHCLDIVAEPEHSESEHENKPSGQIVCPFCWKKLHDKLNGMTHVKACGKNLPIERIFEALQLHERQIKEWEQIGISYPGFQGGNTKPKLPSNAISEGTAKAKRGGGKGRRKKQNLAEDPDLDLAMALSASLHEEVVERQRAEINHLAEAGLHNEAVEKVKATTTTSADPGGQQQEPEPPVAAHAIAEFRLRFSKETKKLQRVQQTAKSQPQASVKTRGGRGKLKDLANTKLYTLSETEKAAIVVERVTQIMENSEKDDYVGKESYKLTEFDLNSIGCGRRLRQFCNEELKLWKMSSEMNEIPNEELYTSSLKECKKQVQAIEDSKKERTRRKNNSKAIDVLETSDVGTHVRQKPTLKGLGRGPPKEHGRNSESFSGSRGLTVTTNRKETGSSTSGLGQDFLKLLTQKIDTDLTIYGREEKPIRAHRLILQARCPKLLQEIVVEESPTGRKSEIIALTCFSHQAVKSLVWHLYSGKPFPFNSDNSELTARYLEEMEELAQKYNFRLDDDERCPSNPKQHCIKCSVEKINQEAQTDKAAEVKQSTISSTSNTGLSYMHKNNHTHDNRNDHVVFSEDGQNSDFKSSLNSSTDETKVTSDRRLSTESTGSVDLFDGYGDSDSDVEVKETTETLVGDDSLEAKKKRSRSLSPQLEDVIVLDDSPFSQANKKYKLDSSNYSSPTSIPVHIDNDNADDEVSLLSLCESDKQSLADEVLGEILTPHDSRTFTSDTFRTRNGDCVPMTSPVSRHSACVPHNGKKIPRLSQARRSLRQDVTLAANKLSFSSHSPSNDFLVLNDDNQFHFPQEQSDNYWDYEGNDDSVFARIPEEILKRNSPPISHPSRSSQLSPIPVHSSLPYVSRHKYNEKDNDNVVKTNSKNSKDKVKGVNRRNISCSQPLQHRNTFEENLAMFTSTNGPTPPMNAQTQGASRREVANQTPMLNYSTIDTPILKKELKKYGLKPLPRTKAKLLLRHIYKETHKPTDDDD